MASQNGSPTDGNGTGTDPIKIIIVGAGFAGLACAIESKLKGHGVVVLEKFSELKVLGDIISFGPNAGKILDRWGIGDTIWPLCTHLKVFHLHTWKGDLINAMPVPEKMWETRNYNGHRGELHQILFDFAKKLGVDIRLSSNVTEYWEDEQAAGVVCNGERLIADVVIGADGVRSKAREMVLGYFEEPKPSGYAIYRAWFSAKESGIADDPLAKCLVADGEDQFYGWIGKDVHMLCSSAKGAKDISWVITHKDEADIEDSWSFPGKMEDVLKVVEGWDPRCAAILSKAPSCVDWKLVYRDPLPTWISKKARIAIIGDAAHPFLPTSVQGASQAMEDGVTIAVNLKLAGKGDVPLAIRAFEKMRYDRVRKAQRTGETNRDRWHKTEDTKAKEDPDSVAIFKDSEWLMNHDSEKHAFAAYPEAVKEIKEKGYHLPQLPEGDVAEERVAKQREEYLARAI